MSISLGSKLRDSCHACAASKVKCQKEKPICSRCARRGTACQYFVTKRPGRKCNYRANEQVQILDCTTLRAEPDWSTPSSSVSSPSTTLEEFIDGSDAFAGMLTPQDLYQPNLLSTSENGLDRCITSPIPYFPPINISETNKLTQRGVPTRHRGANSISSRSSCCNSNTSAPLNLSTDSTTLFETSTDPTGNLTPSTYAAMNSYSAGDKQAPHGLPCSCLRTALNFLALFPPLHPTHEDSTDPLGYSNTCSQLPAMQTVMEMIGEIMTSLGNILKCSCSRDAYVLAVICLIVAKILSCYAEAARQVRSDEGTRGFSVEPQSLAWSPIDAAQAAECPFPGRKHNDEMGPLSAPQILSELYRLQGFVEELGKKLQTCRNQSQSVEINDIYTGVDTVFPFSASVLDQLGDGLRKRLNSLSLHIIEVLRRDWK